MLGNLEQLFLTYFFFSQLNSQRQRFAGFFLQINVHQNLTRIYLGDLIDTRNPLVASILQVEELIETLPPVLEFDSLKLQLKSGIFICISRFSVYILGMQEGVNAYLIAPTSPLNSPTIFYFHICSLYCTNSLDTFVLERLLYVALKTLL